MPRRFFRKFAIKRHVLVASPMLAPFRGMLHEPRYWAIRRRSVVPAFALGLFVAFMPFPGHPLVGALFALALRVNIPVTIVTTFVSNPLTMGPMYFSAFRLGRELLGWDAVPFRFELSFDWLSEQFVNIWQPMLLGSLLLGSAAALVGYVVLDLLWRLSVHDYKSRKRRRRDETRSD